MSGLTYSTGDARTLAQTELGEARGEGRMGMVAVAWVVRTRAEHACWWGQGVVGVCLAHDQFSCWNSNDPNRHFITTLPEHDPLYVEALAIAEAVLSGQVADPTEGADSYYATTSEAPPWAAHATKTALIGHHQFCRVQPEASPIVPNIAHRDPADLLNADELTSLNGA